MVVSARVGAVAAEETGFAFAECDAEVVGGRIDRQSHVCHSPAARAGQFGTENVEAAIAGMAV